MCVIFCQSMSAPMFSLTNEKGDNMNLVIRSVQGFVYFENSHTPDCFIRIQRVLERLALAQENSEKGGSGKEFQKG